MAEVWEAHDTILDRRVAAKILYTHLASDPGFVARFRREAVSSARLNHPAIVTVFDTGVDVDPRQHGQRAYIIMELVPGKTLRALLTEGAVGLDDAVDIIAQAADGLSYAHTQGVVHRDVKPANIMVQPDGRVKVADFGIAKAIQDTNDLDDLTQVGAILGTAKYLSPEQVDGTAVDARSDIYSLGVVLYEAAVGKPPFVGPTDLATAMLHVNGTTQRPRQVRPEIPRSLEQVIIKAMARDPHERFSRAQDMVRALRAEPLLDDAIPLVTRTAADVTPPYGVTTYRDAGSAPHVSDQSDTILVDSERTRIDTRPRDTRPRGSQGEESRAVSQPSRISRLGPKIVALSIAGLVIGAIVGWSFGSVNASPIRIAEVRVFDPPPGEGRENTRLLPRLLDGTRSAWVTETYSAGFAGLSTPKRGVGIVINLGELRQIDALQVGSMTAGWSAEIFVADFVGDDLSSWGSVVARANDIPVGEHRIAVGRRTRLVLLWITNLGPQNTNVSLSEIRAYARS